jgi:hypothetical protein
MQSDLFVDHLVGWVKVIFDLPEWVPQHLPLGPLAYVEWFTPLRKSSRDHPCRGAELSQILTTKQ